MKPLPSGGAIVHWKHGNPRSFLRSDKGEAATTTRRVNAASSLPFVVLKLVPSNAEKVERLTGMTIAEIKTSGCHLRISRRRAYLYSSDFLAWIESRPSV